MKKLVLFILVFSGVSFLSLNHVHAQDVHDFTFESFEADYYLGANESRNPNMRVTEILKARFTNPDTNHGIIRSIFMDYQDLSLDLEISSITNEAGEPHNYSTSEYAGFLDIRIGDADKYVFGDVTYIINYSLKNNILFLDDSQEFYWDINGDGWGQPFDTVTGRIHLLDALADQLTGDMLCFKGSYGESNQDCEILFEKDEVAEAQGFKVIKVQAEDVQPYETLTVVLGFADGTFVKDPWPAQKLLLTILGAISMPVTAFGYMYSRWLKFGKDPRGKTVVVPQYEPLDGFNVVSSDVVVNEKLNTPTISAGIVELAISGYIRIHETQKKKLIGKEDEYSFELLKSASDAPQELKEIAEALFTDSLTVGSKVNISEKKHKLYTKTQALIKNMPTRMWEKGYFKEDPKKVKTKYFAKGFLAIPLVIAFGAIFKLPILAVAAGLSGVVISAFAPFMPAKTAKGVEARTYILGLDDYIQLAEAERIKYLQSPEGVKQYKDPTSKETKVELFEKLLPYAMLFGHEKEWAKEFKDLYEQPPDWLNTTNQNFNAVYLGSMLSRVNTASVTAFTPPSSSGSSSGSSGFGGGGFSGGGGGGGGGGGW